MSELRDEHEPGLRFMGRALELARKGLYTTRPNPMVGCVIVKNGQIVGEGFHEYTGGAHAEVLALEQAGRQAQGSDMYLTLEPCAHHGRTPPCCEAIIAAKVRRVVIGSADPNPGATGGFARLQEEGLVTEFSPLGAEAEKLNPGFFSRHKRKRPWIRIKLAISLDGRIALKNGDSRWISGEESRQDVQFWRAGSCAILSSSRTVLNDNPKLNVRLKASDLGARKIKQPLRVIVDYGLKIPPHAKIFQQPGSVLLATCSSSPVATQALKDVGAQVLLLPPEEPGRVPLGHLMQELAKREINEVQVEAGGTLCGALIASGLYDELLLYQAPCLLGNDALAMANVPRLDAMQDRIEVTLLKNMQLGNDLRLLFRKGENK